MTAPSLLDELEGVRSDDLGRMNSALCDFAMRWEIDGDYMRCRKCKRPQITNYASHDFPHADGCKAAGTAEVHPWKTFIHLLQPLIRDHAEIAAMAKRMEAAERDAARLRRALELLPTKVETKTLGDYGPEEIAAFDSGYNMALDLAHNLLRRQPGAIASIDAATQEGEG